MKVLRAVQIAKREWENIRISLENCGDIGEVDFEDSVNSEIMRIEGFHLVKNLIEMESKLSKYGYFTPEAAYVFSTLALGAAKRLGLTCRLAHAFGSGYSLVRTGYFDLNGITDEEEHPQIIKRLFFLKLFFPVGGDFNWDFNSPVVKAKLKLVFHNFVEWQDDPRSFIQDVRNYKAQLEPLLRGLLRALRFSLADDSEEYEIEEWIEHRM